MVIGIGLILASTFLPIQYNLILQTGKTVAHNYYFMYAKEIDDEIRRTYNLGLDLSLNLVLSKSSYIKYENSYLKIIINGEEFFIGKYPFEILVDDKRNLGGEATISFSRRNDNISVVIEDA